MWACVRSSPSRTGTAPPPSRFGKPRKPLRPGPRRSTWSSTSARSSAGIGITSRTRSRRSTRLVVRGGAILKVIFENDYLEDAHIIRLCEICSEHAVAFVKTSTGYGFVKQPNGFYSYAGATDHALRLMRAHSAPAVQIKAAGGVRTLDDLLRVREPGRDPHRRHRHPGNPGRGQNPRIRVECQTSGFLNIVPAGENSEVFIVRVSLYNTVSTFPEPRDWELRARGVCLSHQE